MRFFWIRFRLVLGMALWSFLEKTDGYSGPQQFRRPSSFPSIQRHGRIASQNTRSKEGRRQTEHRFTSSICMSLSINTHASAETLGESGERSVEEGARSRIQHIKATNLGGFVSNIDDGGVLISFPKDETFIAVTGSSASGKSLLLAKTIDLICGAKAAASFVRGESAKIEMQFALAEPHLSAVVQSFQELKLDTRSLLESKRLVLERTLTLTTTKRAGDKPLRLKSTCHINGQSTTLKSMASLSQRLLVVVDAAGAAAALAAEDARLQILDMGVSSRHLTAYHAARLHYKQCRQRRRLLQKELADGSKSKLASGLRAESNLELLQHYIDELDSLQRRTTEFCRLFRHDLEDPPTTKGLASLCHELAATQWNDSLVGKSGSEPFRSALFEKLVALRDAVVRLDEQISCTIQMNDAISSLSSPVSAATAIEKARKHLLDVTGRQTSALAGARVDAAAEQAHDMLNGIESAIATFTRSIEDDELGLINALQQERSCCPVTLDQLDALICDWGSLSRKHGVSSSQLPSCHDQLKHERDGSSRALELLPQAIIEEDEARGLYEQTHQILLEERRRVAAKLQADVTTSLSSLAMDQSVFSIDMVERRKLQDASVISGAEDSVVAEFRLSTNSRSQALVHESASSGEKARLLLALENSMPGCVGALQRVRQPRTDVRPSLHPILVVYDEIDSHVGGSAANTLASMLARQSNNGQILAITHSPAVGALADIHLVVQKSCCEDKEDSRVRVAVREVVAIERRQELARMASGDLAPQEAQRFAEALIREGALRRGKV